MKVGSWTGRLIERSHKQSPGIDGLFGRPCCGGRFYPWLCSSSLCLEILSITPYDFLTCCNENPAKQNSLKLNNYTQKMNELNFEDIIVRSAYL